MKRLLILGSLVLLVAAGCNQKSTQQTTQIPTQNQSNHMETYTNKFIQLQYPSDWSVQSGGEYIGTDGFSLWLISKNNTVNDHDGLGVATYHDADDNADYQHSQSFRNQSGNISYINFQLAGYPVFASCKYKNGGQESLDICNQIIKSLKFYQP